MDGMNLYERGPTWWIRFQDHRGHQRRLRGAKSKRTAERIGGRIQQIVDMVACGQPLPMDMASWILTKLDPKRIAKLKDWDIVSDASLAIGNPLTDHLEAWRDGLINRRRPESYVDLRHDRAEKLLTAAGATYYSDIDAERVQSVLAEWEGRFSDYTRAHYLGAAKSFCRWMAKTKRGAENPLAILAVSRGTKKYHRHPLNEGQQKDLVAGTRNLGEVNGMTGQQRSMLYRVALSTGLRASAIRRLLVKDISFDESSLQARGGGASNKTTSAKPLSASLTRALRAFVQGMDAKDLLFDLPHETKLARMLRADADACGVPTEGLDFHALRHTFGTTMAKNGTQPRTLMSLMDHKTIQMTMALYTHSFPEDELAAINRLPDLDDGDEVKKEVV